jgi:hypothetical protein
MACPSFYMSGPCPLLHAESALRTIRSRSRQSVDISQPFGNISGVYSSAIESWPMQKKTDYEGISGIQRVTAIARDPHRNRGFFAEVLELRLVKLPLWLQSRREKIQQALTRIKLPRVAVR